MSSTTTGGRRGSFRRSGGGGGGSGGGSGGGGVAATTGAYVSVSVRSLDSSVLLDVWNAALTKMESLSPGSSRRVVGGMVGVASVALLALWTLIDVLALYSKVCGVVVPVAALICGYLLLALTFRSTWTSTGIYLTFCGGVIGEIIGFFLFNMMTGANLHPVSISIGIPSFSHWANTRVVTGFNNDEINDTSLMVTSHQHPIQVQWVQKTLEWAIKTEFVWKFLRATTLPFFEWIESARKITDGNVTQKEFIRVVEWILK